MASVLAMGMARELGFELAIARLFHCYGAGQHRDSFWPLLQTAAHAGRDFAMTSGEQVYDFSPVEVSVAKLCALLTSGSGTAGEPRQVNVGSGIAVRLADFAREWWTRWNARGELRLGAVPYRRGEVMRLVPALEGENCA
jgi:nucleoside-diphosphate-sugar epimerase